ncbi:cryptochrome/photolyase family protein [Salinirarus marinus]|uniref:cryptochrome/photolyase family protein n=1 Tax=Salinirarus marinus TaxID=3068310 RepID=UPI003C6C7848
MYLHWHRRDLRASDNRALAAAAADGSVVPVFVFDDALLAHASAPRVRFMLDALRSLRADYRERGSDLVVARGDPRDVLPDLLDGYDADGLTWNRDYSAVARRRDTAVRDAVDVPVEASHDALLHEPGSITTNAGDHYSVYSYFWEKWRDREKADPRPTPTDALADADGDPLPTVSDLGFDDPAASTPKAGTTAARRRLAEFCTGPIFRYERDRDYPAREGTSRLSADLKWGTVGIREVYAVTEEAMADAEDDAARASVTEFRSQLAWREFYAHVLAAEPRIVSENYREYEHDVEWRNDPAEIEAWKRGETGYPIVDAGMRQLREEAYLHNRVRMIVASFLTKDLMVDWRVGYDWFRERLADHDAANDSGGWQWAASTGTDAQPYFRIFNPTTQGERYDPDAEYITTYVPELRGVAPETIHSWPDCSPAEREAVAPDYFDPVVDHDDRRADALAMFEAARGDD